MSEVARAFCRRFVAALLALVLAGSTGLGLLFASTAFAETGATAPASTAGDRTVEIAQYREHDIEGRWRSDYGPVFLEHRGGNVHGSWEQREGVGRIYDGVYERSTGRLEFLYAQPWNGARGRATLFMSRDGRRLSGEWVQNDTSGRHSGQWNLWR